jgi:hypothetical protein
MGGLGLEGGEINVRGLALMVAFGLALMGPAAGATDRAATFAERLAQVRTPLQVGNGAFGGAGATILAQAVSDARYVLIGEDHLTREIVAHPDSMAFQNGSDESDMAAACAQAAGPGFRLWGLDQEFFGAAGNLIERMTSAHPGPIARAAIARLATAERSATAAALLSGAPGQLLVYAITDRERDDARAAIAKDGGARVRALFAAFEETRAIYLSQNADPYASNGARARLMKRTLLDYLTGAPEQARVLFKFGDAHVRKGINGFGQRDLGNFVAERADGEGVASLHLLVVGLRGTHALYNGVGRQVRHEPFVLTDDADFAWLKDAVPGGDATKDWTLLDLRPLRVRPPRDLPAAWKQVIDGFDMVVVAPAVTPSSLLGAR